MRLIGVVLALAVTLVVLPATAQEDRTGTLRLTTGLATV